MHGTPHVIPHPSPHTQATMGDSSGSSTRDNDGDGADGETTAGSLAQKPYRIKKRQDKAVRTPSPTTKDDQRASRDRSEEPSFRQHSGTHPPRSLGMEASGAGMPLAAPFAPGTWPDGPLSGTPLINDPIHLRMMQQLAPQQQQQQVYLQQQQQMQRQLQQQMQQQLGQQMMHMHGTHPSCGGYPPLGGYPPQPGGAHTTSSAPSAPLLWRGGEGQHSPPSAPLRWREGEEQPVDNTLYNPEQDLAAELAAAAAKWQRLDNHQHLMDPEAKPQVTSGTEGSPLIDGQRLFASATLNDDMIFVGTRGNGRWALASESVTVYISDRQNTTPYTKSEIRESVVAEVEALASYDGNCISEDLPEAIRSTGPWKMILAAAAAKAMIDAEGVTVIAYDKKKGIRNQRDFDVELRLPSGKPYPQERKKKPVTEPKARDKSKRISCCLQVPQSSSGRDRKEEIAADKRLRAIVLMHFRKFNAQNVGFFHPRDAETGRRESILSVFANHPEDVTREQFVRTAFSDFKYIEAGLGDLVKVSLDTAQTRLAGTKNCCFRTVCPSLPGREGCSIREILMRKHNLTTSTPKNEPGKRKVAALDGPTPEQMEERKKVKETMKDERVTTQCRAHTRGRCIHGSKCMAPHITPAAEIMCNSTVQPGVKASINNTTYGFCRLSVEAKIPCPYKGCLHVSNPSQETGFDSDGAVAAQMQAEMADEIAALDEEIMDEAEGEQAIAETMASELAAIEDKTPGNKPPGDDLR